MVGGVRGLVVKMSVCSWQTYPDLRLICGWHVSKLRGLSLRYGPTNQANSAFHPFGVAKK